MRRIRGRSNFDFIVISRNEVVRNHPRITAIDSVRCARFDGSLESPALIRKIIIVSPIVNLMFLLVLLFLF